MKYLSLILMLFGLDHVLVLVGVVLTPTVLLVSVRIVCKGFKRSSDCELPMRITVALSVSSVCSLLHSATRQVVMMSVRSGLKTESRTGE